MVKTMKTEKKEDEIDLFFICNFQYLTLISEFQIFADF